MQGGRNRNEDAFLADPEKGLFAVADGIGGGYHGDLASRMAIEQLRLGRASGLTLRKCFDRAQKVIIAFSQENIGEALMGTTLTALEVKNDGIQICHIGDSRCYQFTRKFLRKLTEDHETFEESMQNPVLSEYLGAPDDLVPLRVQSEFIPCSGHQRFLLCTDGLHRQLQDQEIAEEVERSGPDPGSVVSRLCFVASQKEDSDNVTVVFVEIEF